MTPPEAPVEGISAEYFSGLTESWETLRNSPLPVCIYGMGDACERLLKEFDKRGIKCAAIFASDGFVRGQSFCGYEVKTLSRLERDLGGFTVCCAFGSSLPEVMSNISEIAASHTLVCPDLPIAGEKFFSPDELLARFGEAEDVFYRLADDRSRRVFKGLLSFKVTGDISCLTEIFSDPEKDISELIPLGNSEVYADLGAYTGDTAERFISRAGGNYERLYLFEPDKRSFRKCVKRLMPRGGITFVNACGWNCDTRLRFLQSAGRQSRLSSEGELIRARSLDSVLGGKRCTFIKYDVEGAEKEALKGSRLTIERYAPALAVSAYHRPFDLLELPELILSLDSGYKLYLRQPPYFPAWDSVIYAVKDLP